MIVSIADNLTSGRW